MKNLIKTGFFFLLLLSIPNIANAQDESKESKTEPIDLIIEKQEIAEGKKIPEDPQFLAGSRTKVSGFLASSTEFSSIGDDLAVGTGGGLAILINQSIFFGAYGQGITTSDFRVWEENTVENPLNIRPVFGHGGFWIGGNIFSKKVVHLTVSTKLGWGVLGVFEEDFDFDFDRELVRDLTFVATPEVGVEVNIAKWMKINGTVGYRYAPGISNPYYAKNSLDGVTGSINLLFGWFGQK